MAEVVYFVRDLTFVAKIRETADQLGIAVAPARDLDTLEREANGARVVIVDLRLADAPAALERLARTVRPPAPTTVGFVDHERTDVMETARALGCTRVLAKGQFAAELPRLLAPAA
jgi:AmiR/NasT family two-component response regulator